MVDGTTVARRSARVFEAEESLHMAENILAEPNSNRKRPADDDARLERRSEKEFSRHSRNSSTSTCSGRILDNGADNNSLSRAVTSEIVVEDTSISEKAGAMFKEKLETRPELNFGVIIPDVYRSGCPGVEDHDVLRSLGLKTILSLADKERPEEYKQFMDDHDINHILINMQGTKKAAIPLETMREIMSVVLDSRNYPILIHCNHGRHRTGCVVAIVRKLYGLEVPAIVEEYKHFSMGKPREVDIDYIHAFDLDTVLTVAHEARRVSRLSSSEVVQTPLATARMSQLIIASGVVLLIWGYTLLNWER